jgi:gamma-glutamyl-gamma-aminobutyrate hydrolase PuuD
MSFVAVTMMRVHEPARDEWRDAVDVRWTAFLARCGLQPLYMPNDAAAAVQLLERTDPAGVVLTGGGNCSALSGRVDERDRTEAAALDWAASRAKPVLGVCRGMQVLLARAGAPLERVHDHVGRRHTVEGVLGGRAVNSFHEYGFRTAPAVYAVQARSDDGVVEAAMDASARHAAVMWHPEREVEPDTADLALFRRVFGDKQ